MYMWGFFDKFIDLLEPENMATFMTRIFPQMMDAMPAGHEADDALDEARSGRAGHDGEDDAAHVPGDGARAFWARSCRT